MTVYVFVCFLCILFYLTAAHALYESKRVDLASEIQFHSLRNGVLTARKSRSVGGAIEMSFPIVPALPASSVFTGIIQSAFKLASTDILFIGQSEYDVLVEVSPSSFALLDDIDYTALRSLPGRGVLVTCVGPKYSGQASSSGVLSADFLSRCFFPRCGIDEDPVVSEVHCVACIL